MRTKRTVSPYPEVFSPRNLERELQVERQIRNDEETVVWGADDAFPLRIINAVDESPTTLSCLDQVKKFLQGSEFSDQGLMDFVIDKDGTTLWDFHGQLCEYLSVLDGFTVNFKYDIERRITNAYCIPIENCRFKKSDSKQIHKIKYNPYFGTNEYDMKYTKEYDVFNLKTVIEELTREGTGYKGQIYFYGAERPRYKFYPVPKYWSGNKWIYVDGQIQTFHKKNLDNGFFQSILMKLIGDPNQPSKNPKYQKYKENSDGTKVPDGSTHTVGQEFSEMMSEQFSGVKEAGSVMAVWAKNRDESAEIQAFPSNTQFDLLQGTFTDAIRGITIATQVPAILANLPQQASSLGSDGNSIRAAIELMQARVAPNQRVLENFYNNVLLPNLQDEAMRTKKIKIKNYSPITTQVTIEDKYWEFMDDAEKADFINNNVPGITVKPRVSAEQATTAPDQATEQTTETPEPSQAMQGLSLSTIDKINGIKNRMIKGKITVEQAVTMIKTFGFSDDEIMMFLKPE